MTRATIECPQCNQRLAVPQSAWGKTIPCPACHWPIAVPHPDRQPPSAEVLAEQTDILADYHQRLVVLYERTTILIEQIRTRQAAAQIEIETFVDDETQRVAVLVEIARTELQTIIDAAERAARRAAREAAVAPRKKLRRHFPHETHCPHCGRRLRYKNRGAGKQENCPNPKCGQPIRLPSVSESFWQAIDRNEQSNDL